MLDDDHAEEIAQLDRMRLASVVEGTTLLVLLGVAVPLKHLAGVSAATAVMGPVHGLAFVFYVWTVVQTVSGGGWTRSEALRLGVAALVPFGGFVNERSLARRRRSLVGRV
jgi:integral membrane protein